MLSAGKTGNSSWFGATGFGAKLCTGKDPGTTRLLLFAEE